MATEYTDIGLKQATPKPSNMLEGSELTGGVNRIKAVYTTSATTADGNTVNLVKLPKGTIIYPRSSYVTSSGSIGSSSCTLTVGANDDVDALSTALDVDAAGTDSFALNAPVELTSESWVTATLSVGGTATADETLTFILDVVYP